MSTETREQLFSLFSQRGIVLSEEIGRGISSAVYRGTARGTVVAVKVHHEVSNPASSMQSLQLRREAACLARVGHEGLPRVFEAGEIGGRPYILLELVQGESLSKVLERGPLDAARIVRIGARLAAALAEIHRAGLVHRDIKPANVVVDSQGNAKLVDLGLAVDGSETSARDDVAGTFQYAAPEQLNAGPQGIDARADLYALGALLYECATGRPPHSSTSLLELIRWHATNEVPDPSALRPALDPVLSRIIRKLLAKEPSDRYASAAALALDLATAGDPGPGARDAKAPAPPVASSSLLGRASELRRLEDAFRGLEAGRGVLAHVHGIAGIGKTALVRAFVSDLEAKDVLVLGGQCFSDDATPFGAIRRAIEGIVQRLPSMAEPARKEARERLRRAAAGHGSLLAGFAPRLDELLGSGAAKPTVALRQELFLDTLVDFVVRVASPEAPAVMLLEDIQWLDEPSTLFLRRLCMRLAETPLLLLCTSRPEIRKSDNDKLATGAAPIALVADTERRAGSAITIALEPLDAPSITSLIRGFLGKEVQIDADAMALILSSVAGNPGTMRAYVGALLDASALGLSWGRWTLAPERLASLALPNDVLQLIAYRVGLLSAATRRVLATAALAGSSVEPRVLARVVDATDENVRAAIHEGIARDVLTGAPGRPVFVHEHARHVLGAALDEATRRALHQRWAATLDSTDALPSREDLFTIADHYARGVLDELPQRTTLLCQAAGEAALREFAIGRAVHLLETAREAVESSSGDAPATLETSLADAYWARGEATKALAARERALVRTSEPHRRAAIRAANAHTYLMSFASSDAWRELHRGLSELSQPYPRTRLGLRLSLLFQRLRHALRGEFGAPRIAARDEDRLRALARLYDAAARVVHWVGSLADCHYVGERLLHCALAIGKPAEAVRGHAMYAMMLACVGRHPRARDHARKAEEIAEEAGDPQLIVAARRALAMCAVFAGDDREAERLLRTIMHDYARYMDVNLRQRTAWHLAWSLLFRGSLQEAIEWVERGLGDAEVDAQADGLHNRALRLGLQASLCAVAADMDRSNALIAEAFEVGGQAREERYLWGELHCHRALILLEQNRLGRELDEALGEFFQLRINPRLGPPQLRNVYILLAQARTRQLEAAETPLLPHLSKAEARERADVTLGVLEPFADLPLHACFALTLAAARARSEGAFDFAIQKLAQAEVLAAQLEAPSALFEVARQRALVLRDHGAARVADKYAGFAHALAVENGWRARAQQWLRVFPEAQSNALPTARDSAGGRVSRDDVSAMQEPTGVTVEDMSIQRGFEALRDVMAAASASFEAVAQCRAALDALVKNLDAERGFIFLADDAGVLGMQAGRDASGNDLVPLKGYSKTVAMKAFEEKRPIVVAGSAEGEALGSESAVVYNLRSIVAAPLLIESRALGVVYVDSTLAHGLFTGTHVEIVQAVANQLAIAINVGALARAQIATEVQRSALEKELDLLTAVQTLCLPEAATSKCNGVSITGHHRAASHCSGDWWWYEHPTKDTTVVLVGDVTGHGAASAMLSAVVVGSYRALRASCPEWRVEQVLGAASDVLREVGRGRYLMSVSAVVIDRAKQQIVVTSAGGTPVLIARADGRVDVVTVAGTLLGSSEAPVFGVASVPLHASDRVCIFSDGLLENRARGGRRGTGLRLLRDMLVNTRSLSGAATLAHTVARLAPADEEVGPVADDVTMVLADIEA